MDLISQNFPALSEKQIKQYGELEALYTYWNTRINVISRKDIDALYIKHVLHSLGIAKVQPFLADSKVLDVGTGGGFPVFRWLLCFPRLNLFWLIQ